MKRRSLLHATAIAAALVVPEIAVASQRPEVIKKIKDTLTSAGIYYEDNIPFDQAGPYFHGVLAGLLGSGIIDDFVVAPITGVVGSIADVAVKIDGNEFIYFPIRFSPDYWLRNPLHNLT